MTLGADITVGTRKFVPEVLERSLSLGELLLQGCKFAFQNLYGLLSLIYRGLHDSQVMFDVLWFSHVFLRSKAYQKLVVINP